MATPQENRDVGRFGALVSPILPDLYRFAYRLERDRPRAEDLLQQALLTGLERLHQLQDDAAFRVWVSRIVFRTHLNQRARRSESPMENVDNVVALERPGPEQVAGARQLGRTLGAALDALPADQRAAVWLVDGQGFKYGEAADVLGVRPGTVASRVARARVALRADLHQSAHDHGVLR